VIPGVKRAQCRRFLVMVRCHAGEHGVEHFDGFKNERAFVANKSASACISIARAKELLAEIIL
jgi:hypothetical protein